MDQFQGPSPHEALGDGEFRYVRLLPAVDPGSPIECELVRSQPLMDGSYEAVSYVWGDPRDTVPTSLEGAEFPITRNLSEALRHLRLENQPRLLWVDALCINQTDHQERGHQVAKMREIYAKAGRILVWLGGCHPHTEEQVKSAFELARYLGQNYKRISPEGYGEVFQDITTPEDAPRLHVLSKILVREWFRRVWIAQEVLAANAPKVKLKDAPLTPVIVHCGSLNIDFASLAWAQRQALHMTPSLAARAMKASGIKEIKSMEHLQKAIYLRTRSKYPFSLSLAHELMGFLVMSTQRQATEPRDKIFALYGLLSTHEIESLPPELAPDYKVGIDKIYHAVAKYLVENAGFADLLAFGTQGPEDELSWVPNWESTKFPRMSWYNVETTWLMAHLWRPKLAHGDRHLALQGTRVGVVAGVAPFTIKRWGDLEDEEESFHYMRLYLAQCEDALGITEQLLPRWIEMLTYRWRLHRYSTQAQKSEDMLAAYKFVRNYQRGHDIVESKYSPALYQIYDVLRSAYPIMDSQGSFNVTDQYFHAKAGDVIFAFPGAFHNYVLRTRDASRNTFSRIGPLRMRAPVLDEAWHPSPKPKAQLLDEIRQFWDAKSSELETVYII